MISKSRSSSSKLDTETKEENNSSQVQKKVIEIDKAVEMHKKYIYTSRKACQRDYYRTHLEAVDCFILLLPNFRQMLYVPFLRWQFILVIFDLELEFGDLVAEVSVGPRQLAVLGQNVF